MHRVLVGLIDADATSYRQNNQEWRPQKNTQRVAGLLTAMAIIVKPPCDEGVILASPCDGPAPANGGWIIAATILGSSMAFTLEARCNGDQR